MGNPNFLRGRISNSQASCQKLGFPERKDFIVNKNFKIFYEILPFMKSKLYLKYSTLPVRRH